MKLSTHRVGDTFVTPLGSTVEVTDVSGVATRVTYDGEYSYVVSQAWLGRRLTQDGWRKA